MVNKNEFEKLRRSCLYKIMNENERELKWEEFLKKKENEIEIMFIAEAPKELDSYFYNYEEESTFRNNLLGPLGFSNDDDYEGEFEKINKFYEKYWLIDIFNKPIDGFEGLTNISEHFDCLLNEIEIIDPQKILLILPKLRNYQMNSFLRHLFAENFGYKKKNVKIAPFPNQCKLPDYKSFKEWAREHEEWLGIKRDEKT